MRAVFGVLSLLLVVAVVGLLVKKQLATATAGPGMPEMPAASVSAPAATPKQQVLQFQHAVEGAMQQARPMPDDK